MTVSDFSERDLIARIQERLAPPPDWLLVGIGDDAAVVEPERNRLEVFSVDAVVDGVHFDRAVVPPDAIGHRALAVNLSDLAAMGATPRLALVSMAIPADLQIDDFDGIALGLARLAATSRVHVVGGNLTRTPGPLTIDVTVVGTVKRRRALTRSGARPGDEVYVTGTIGAAAAGLQMLRSSTADGRLPTETADRRLPTAYLYPQPRLRAGTLVSRNRISGACMDLSDGLADAANQISAASGVGMEIDGGALPIPDAARRWFESRGADPVASAVTGGDDYELLITVRPRLRRRLAAVVRQAGVPFTRIGTCSPGAAVLLDGQPMPAGYAHFGSRGVEGR